MRYDSKKLHSTPAMNNIIRMESTDEKYYFYLYSNKERRQSNDKVWIISIAIRPKQQSIDSTIV